MSDYFVYKSFVPAGRQTKKIPARGAIEALKAQNVKLERTLPSPVRTYTPQAENVNKSEESLH